MFHFNRIHISRTSKPVGRIKEEIWLTPSISVPFLFGLIIGSLTGSLTEILPELFIPFESQPLPKESITFLTSLWRSIRFPMMSALLATSILGAVLIPLLSACRAYIFACSAAIILRKTADYAYFSALISLGIPALMNLPAFFLASEDTLTISRYLLKRDEKFRIRDLPLLQHSMIVFLLCIIETMYLTYIVPILLPHMATAFK